MFDEITCPAPPPAARDPYPPPPPPPTTAMSKAVFPVVLVQKQLSVKRYVVNPVTNEVLPVTAQMTLDHFAYKVKPELIVTDCEFV